jgi:hypothetical protein
MGAGTKGRGLANGFAMIRRPLSITITITLIMISALAWLSLAAIIAAGLHPALPDAPLLKAVMVVLSLIAAGVLMVLTAFLLHRNRMAYFAILAALGASAVAVFLDDVGLIDIMFLLLDLAALALLAKDRNWYLGRGATAI